MEKSYNTILKADEVSLIVRRSKFIGNMQYVKNKEQAQEFILKIKEKYSDARHNVAAYSLHAGGVMYYFDDKEPHGTAGRQALEVLKKNEIYDVCVVITRYFGGVLLGTGGLSLAYSNCCKKILQYAVMAEAKICDFLKLVLSYKYLQKIENIFIAYDVKKIKESYSEDVCLKVVVEQKKANAFKNAILDVTKGEILIVCEKTDWERFKKT